MKLSRWLVLLCLSMTLVASAADVEREVQACNFVTQYLCLLESQQGSSIESVRKELEENLNIRDLHPETIRLLRRISDACDLAETTSHMQKKITEESSLEYDAIVERTVGGAGLTSIVYGDPTSLILGIGSAILEAERLEKKKDLTIELHTSTFSQMLSRWHIEVNQRRQDIIEENQVPFSYFVTRSIYKRFLAASVGNSDENVASLKEITEACPKFREAWYSYGENLKARKNYKEAFDAYNKVIELKQLIIRKDGLKWKAVTEMGACKIAEEKYQEAIRYLELARGQLHDYDRIYYLIAHSYYKLKDYDTALRNIDFALGKSPRNGWYLHLRAQLLLLLNRPDQEVWNAINAVFNNGLGLEVFLDSTYDVAPEMRLFMKRELFSDRMIPRISASVSYGLLFDDVVLVNNSPYRLSNLKIKVSIQGLDDNFMTNDDVVESVIEVAEIGAGDSHTCSSVFSIRGNAPTIVSIEFSCDQSPAMWQWNSRDKKWSRMCKTE